MNRSDPMAAPAAGAAAVIADSFVSWVDRFRDFSRRARAHFENGYWHAVQRDSVQRLDLYNTVVAECLARLRPLAGGQLDDRAVWTNIRSEYARLIAGRGDAELAETFFNSVSRRVFHTIGADPALAFVTSIAEAPADSMIETRTFTVDRSDTLTGLVREVLEHFRLATAYDDADGDAERVARAMIEHLGERRVRRIEVAQSLFFRGKGAYAIGLAHTDGDDMPMVLALTNPAGRVVVDAALFTEDEVSVVFSFARSYFSVEMERPVELLAFLRRVMPRKPVAELYSALGFNKHGKTELFRSLLRHLDSTDDRFVVAAGQRGMVMLVFTLPGFDIVFKVIRDRFAFPKTVTHAEVRDKYRLVFRSDRAGRLVDAQEFEHLAFDTSRFDPGLLDELEKEASETVHRDGGRLVFRHLYTERRLRPLDLYLREAPIAAGRDAVVDYGQVLRDLAATNIFPGDMLLKNFGVSRHGRLIFYDYDELVKLADCVFRDLPAPRTGEQETALEPWFYVGEHDIFPEEFERFLGLKGELLDTFLAHHAELLTPAYWRRMQRLHERGEVLDVYPYRHKRRLRSAIGTSGGTQRGA